MRVLMLGMIVAVLCCAAAVPVESIAEQKTIIISAPNVEIKKWATGVIYCDAILQGVLKATAEDKPKGMLTATIDTAQTDRIVIEISEQTLYIHRRGEYEKGELGWGRLHPLELAKGTVKNGILAFSYDTGPKNSGASFFSLNLATGIGLWTISFDTGWASRDPQSKDYPTSTAMYLSCGDRKK
jgi:hypothetical protein